MDELFGLSMTTIMWVLVVLFAVPDAIAKGTSLLVIIPTAISGTFVNLRNDNIDTTVAALNGVRMMRKPENL